MPLVTGQCVDVSGFFCSLLWLLFPRKYEDAYGQMLVSGLMYRTRCSHTPYASQQIMHLRLLVADQVIDGWFLTSFVFRLR